MPADTRPLFEREVAKSVNSFTTDLYGHLRHSKGNLFFSPLNISNALAVIYGGAREKTAEEMANVFHFPTDQGKLHPGFAALAAQLNDSSDGGDLCTKVGLWLQQGGCKFRPDFIDLCKTCYQAEFEGVDFRGGDLAEIAGRINHWTSKATKEKIPQIITKDNLSADTRLVLVSAIYFLKYWASKFDKSMTRDENFFLTSTAKQKVKMMNKYSAKLPYYEEGDVQVLEIPFEKNAYSMFLFLPKLVDGLLEFEQSFTADRMTKLMQSVWSDTVHVHLPKFKLESEFSLADTLQKMGMRTPFSDQANFSGITEDAGGLKISHVIHKAVADVSEDGAEFAAATAVTMVCCASIGVVRVEPKTFRADHPFVFAFRDNRSGAVLSLGRFVKP